MSTSRFNLSYDFAILSENSAQANDKNFVDILFDDLEDTEERNIARFQLYLEEVLHLIIEGRDLREFSKLIEQALKDYIVHIKTTEYPKISPRKKNNIEAQNRTLAIRTKSRKASDSILLMGNKVLDFFIDVIREKHPSNEDFILLLSYSPDWKAEKLSTFFSETSKMQSNIKIESLIEEKIYLEVIDERNGLTTDKEIVMDLILHFSYKVPLPITETNIREYWKGKFIGNSRLSKPRLSKILDLINCYRVTIGKKLQLDSNNGDHTVIEVSPAIRKSKTYNGRKRKLSGNLSEGSPAIRKSKTYNGRKRKLSEGSPAIRKSKSYNGHNRKLSGNLSEGSQAIRKSKSYNGRKRKLSEGSPAIRKSKDCNGRKRKLSEETEGSSDKLEDNVDQNAFNKTILSTYDGDMLNLKKEMLEDMLENWLEDKEENSITPAQAAKVARRLSNTIACTQLTVDHVLSIGYHIVEAVQRKLNALKSNVNFIENLQGRLTNSFPEMDIQDADGNILQNQIANDSSKDSKEMDADMNQYASEESTSNLDLQDEDSRKILDQNSAVNSTFLLVCSTITNTEQCEQCEIDVNDSFNFLRTLDAETFDEMYT